MSTAALMVVTRVKLINVSVNVSPQQSKYKGMNKDQWYNVLEFSRTINTDLSNYDEDGACEYLTSLTSG